LRRSADAGLLRGLWGSLLVLGILGAAFRRRCLISIGSGDGCGMKMVGYVAYVELREETRNLHKPVLTMQLYVFT